jgi:hypothetical protein
MESELSQYEINGRRQRVAAGFGISLIVSLGLGAGVGGWAEHRNTYAYDYSQDAFSRSDTALQTAQKNLGEVGLAAGESCRVVITDDYLAGGDLAKVEENTAVDDLIQEIGQPCGKMPRVVRKHLKALRNSSDLVSEAKAALAADKALLEEAATASEKDDFMSGLIKIGLAGLVTGIGVGLRWGQLYTWNLSSEDEDSNMGIGDLFSSEEESIRDYKIAIQAQRAAKQVMSTPRLEDLRALSRSEYQKVLDMSGEIG